MEYEHVLVKQTGDFATITMNRPQRRNALSRPHMLELIAAFTEVGGSSAAGIVLAGNGPVLSVSLPSGTPAASVPSSDGQGG